MDKHSLPSRTITSPRSGLWFVFILPFFILNIYFFILFFLSFSNHQVCQLSLFSSLYLLITCPKNTAFLHLTVLNKLQVSFGSWRTTSFVFQSIHCLFEFFSQTRFKLTAYFSVCIYQYITFIEHICRTDAMDQWWQQQQITLTQMKNCVK